MATAASISARLLLDSTEYEKGLLNAQKATATFQQKLQTIGSSLTSIGRTMTMAFTVPIVAGAVAAGKAFVDLDTQMRNIQSISQQDDKSLEALRQRFISMSTDLNVTRDSAQQLAEAFYFIQSAGFAGEDGMTVLTVATKAATAGLTDTKTAGNAIIAVLNAYGMEAKDASHVSDVLFKTVDLGVLTFQDLTTQLGDVVQTASITGVAIEDVGAALALMTRKGITPSESVTALNQLMLQFISPSEKMKNAAEDIGVELSVATLRSKGLAGALQEIIDKGGGTDALLTLFGDNVRALKGALALAGDGLGDFNDIQKQFQDVAGRTDQAFQTQNKSAAALMDNFKNKATALGITLAEIFLPVVLKLMEGLGFLMDMFRKMPQPIQTGVVMFLLLLAVLGPILLVIGTVITTVGSLITVISTLGPALAVIGTVITGTVLPAIGAVIAALAPIAIPILLIIAVLALLWLAWKNNWGDIRGFTAWVWQGIQNIFSAGWKFLVTLAQAAWIELKAEVMRIVNGIVGLFHIDWGQVGRNIVNGIVKGINSLSSWAVGQMKGFAKSMGDAFNGFFGIKSPSTWGMDRAAYIRQGFEKEWMARPMQLSPNPVTAGIDTVTGKPGATGTSGIGSNAEIITLLRQLVGQGPLDVHQLSRMLRDAILLTKD